MRVARAHRNSSGDKGEPVPEDEEEETVTRYTGRKGRVGLEVWRKSGGRKGSEIVKTGGSMGESGRGGSM